MDGIGLYTGIRIRVGDLIRSGPPKGTPGSQLAIRIPPHPPKGTIGLTKETVLDSGGDGSDVAIQEQNRGVPIYGGTVSQLAVLV